MSRGSKLKALALGALVCTVASPLAAQVVVGGNNVPGVEINWSVLDRLGPAPTLPGMLLPNVRPPQAATQAPAAKPHAPAVAFKPYKQSAPASAAKPAPRKIATKAPARTAAAAPASPEVADLGPPARVAVSEVPPRVEAKPAKPAVPEVPEIVAAPPRSEASKEKGKSPLMTPPPAPEPAKPAQLAPEPSKPAPQVAKVEPPVVAPPTPAPVQAPTRAVESPAPQQQAALPSSGGFLRKGDTLSVLFVSENSRLPDSAKPELNKLASRLEKDDGLSLQLLAYAEGDEANASKARRLSLSRALEVRKYLMELGVRSTRIEVRALGNKVEGGPADRVDAVLASR
ncbi:MAG: OmpA family protein [Magnetospirillum sp.]|nr:OmpA family protein [Magnetospirillum sp.]